ncbi:DUF2987 domain-containing protein [Pseudoalteromonas sp. GB56]
MKSKFFALMALSLPLSVVAEPVVMSYDGFYDRMEVINDGEYQYARVGFYLKTFEGAKDCPLESGKIMTEKQTYPLTYNEHGQLFLPFDKELDTHKAVVVATPKSAAGCQLSMQIEAKMPQQPITAAQLYKVHQEFEELLPDLSGFFVGKLMSFLLPDQEGIQLHFNTAVPIDVPSDWQCVEMRCKVKIDDNWPVNDSKLVDGNKLARITPWIAK